MSWMSRWQERLWGVAAWDEGRISDEWFRAHFGYAADVVNDWVGGALDLRTSRLLNFGCGDGITDLALVLKHGATGIHGVDIRQEYRKLPRIAREQLGMSRIPSALTFETIQPGAPLAGRQAPVDGIMSWSTFEHVDRGQLLPILKDLHACLRPGGFFFIQIEPLFYSPYGSHLRRYDEVPWHHLLVSEEELWEIIRMHEGPIDAAETDFGFADFGPEGYKRFVFNEYRALNRLTADELVGLTAEAGFHVVRQERRSLQMEIPEELRGKYPPEWLLNNEIFLLLGR
ncbi:class I SAM-dependent methyltransferase [Paracidovorax oryzae]|uniref:class I SAM-dependent methyltransferase n=1 Tax=Paracidovorax oryzae TaxID=862720 RepID=UPI000363005B|nr:class I SAM-dependent methyltransferase [Paracidovorax oryzae]